MDESLTDAFRLLRPLAEYAAVVAEAAACVA
jgi:hypothetical protein